MDGPSSPSNATPELSEGDQKNGLFGRFSRTIAGLMPGSVMDGERLIGPPVVSRRREITERLAACPAETLDAGSAVSETELDTGPTATTNNESLDVTPVARVDELVDRVVDFPNTNGALTSGAIQFIIFGYALLDSGDFISLGELKSLNTDIFEKLDAGALETLRDVAFRDDNGVIWFAKFMGLKDYNTARVRPDAKTKFPQDGDDKMKFITLKGNGVSIDVPLKCLSPGNRFYASSSNLSGIPMKAGNETVDDSGISPIATFDYEGNSISGRVLEDNTLTGGKVLVLVYHFADNGLIQRSTYALDSDEVSIRRAEDFSNFELDYHRKLITFEAVDEDRETFEAMAEVCGISPDGKRFLVIYHSIETDPEEPSQERVLERGAWVDIEAAKLVDSSNNEGVTKILKHALLGHMVEFIHDRFNFIPGKVVQILDEGPDSTIPYFMRNVVIEFDYNGELFKYTTLVSNIDGLSSHLADLIPRTIFEQCDSVQFAFKGNLLNGTLFKKLGRNLNVICTDEGFNEGRIFKICPVSRRVLSCEFREAEELLLDIDEVDGLDLDGIPAEVLTTPVIDDSPSSVTTSDDGAGSNSEDAEDFTALKSKTDENPAAEPKSLPKPGKVVKPSSDQLAEIDAALSGSAPSFSDDDKGAVGQFIDGLDEGQEEISYSGLPVVESDSTPVETSPELPIEFTHAATLPFLEESSNGLKLINPVSRVNFKSEDLPEVDDVIEVSWNGQTIKLLLTDIDCVYNGEKVLVGNKIDGKEICPDDFYVDPETMIIIEHS